MTKQTFKSFVVDELQAVTRHGWPQVAQDTGLSVHTIIKIARGIIKSPGVDHIQILYDYFLEKKGLEFIVDLKPEASPNKII